MTALPTNLNEAQAADRNDTLSKYRDEFVFPKGEGSSPIVYFAGHSLGLMPRRTATYLQDECKAWGEYGVEGHFKGKYPWKDYHEFVTGYLARLVGAKESEVVAMNSLTVNLHLMMVSFYKPTQKRFKILIENNTFPSDRYAVASQARFHGFDPNTAVVELKPAPGQMTVSDEDIEAQILKHGDELALVMLGNCNYLSGQCFDFDRVVKAARKAGAAVGFNLAHGAGNLHLKLHDWAPDFAVWCSYKYLNSGAGGIAGAFVHEKHLADKELNKFQGWWGHNKTTRFQMGPQFDPIPTVESWQLSNPPIFQLASLRASLELFDAVGMEKLRARGDQLTATLEQALKNELKDSVEIMTPAKGKRGSMLCMRFKNNPKSWARHLVEKNVHVDFREPDIIRATPAPLYNSYSDIFNFVSALKEVIHEAR